MRESYDSNTAFKNYVDRYCIKHDLTVDVALTHELIRLSYEYYRETSL